MKTYIILLFISVLPFIDSFCAEPIDVWPEFAPGETNRSLGNPQPQRANEVPPVTRMENITRPTFTIHMAPKPNGASVVILPGGGFGKVVTDKEGTEAAAWLNQHGISAFVLSYRTKNKKTDSGWEKALQDAQRTLSIVRSRAGEWGLKKDQIGLLGFSAGGQVAARLLSTDGSLSYKSVDRIDETPYRPDFALLIYPWSIYDSQRDDLISGVSVPETCPPTFIVHTDDDRSSSLGSVLLYAGLKRHGISAEIHVYGNGGHGYGIRKVEESEIETWPGHAAHWLRRRLVPQ